MEITIECQQRPAGSKPNSMRRNGLIPAVLYGHKGAESLSLAITAKNAEKLLKEASLNNTIIDLSIPDLSWTGKTLLREVQTHAWKDEVYHLSFFAVSAQASVDVEVPLHYTGTPAGVKLAGGLLDPVMTEITLRCKPDSIPEAIEVNVSELQIGDALHVGELSLPEGVLALSEPNQVVVSVLPPQKDDTGGEGAATAAS